MSFLYRGTTAWSFLYRSRGHQPSQFTAELETREQRAREIEERYAAVLDAALHQDQQERMTALRIAGGDVRIAKHLLFGQLLFDTARIVQ